MRTQITAILVLCLQVVAEAQIKPNGSTAASLPVLPAPVVYSSGLRVNFVRTWEAMQPVQNPGAAQLDNAILYKQATAYFDGLGRPLQEVIKGGSPDGTKDILSTHLYDALGREALQYLPVPIGGNGGKFNKDPFTAIHAFYNSNYADQRPFSETVFEASPQSRPLAAFAPGNAWAGSRGSAAERAVGQQYLVNTAADSVRVWNTGYETGFSNTMNIPTTTATYAAGELFRNVTLDEQGRQVVEYTDKSGQLILKKAQDGTTPAPGHSGWLSTYYVYDDFGSLRCVIQPKGVQLLQQNSWQVTAELAGEQCFRYEYDERRRMIGKWVPGVTGWTCMVYDKYGRLQFSQDPNQRSRMEFMMYKYDVLNREVMTGIYQFSGSLQLLRDLTAYDTYRFEERANPGVENVGYTARCWPEYNFTLLTATYYDDHNFAGAMAYDAGSNGVTQSNAIAGDEFADPIALTAAMTRGLVTGTRSKLLGSSTWLATTMRYDAKGRPIQAISNNHRGGTDKTFTQYSFTGKVLSVTTIHNNPAAKLPGTQTTAIYETTTYSNNLPVNIRQKINDQAWQNRLVQQYDELGRVKRKEMGNGFNGGADKFYNDFSYNIRGWLTGINKAGFSGAFSPTEQFFKPVFAQLLHYENGFDNNAAAYNGNISGQQWVHAGDRVQRAFGYQYDNINRLTKADFTQREKSADAWVNSKMDFSSPGFAYDANGNLMKMVQRGYGLSTGQNFTMDSLTYNYAGNSNRLLSVSDAGNNTVTTGDFKDVNNGDDYGYDANGNMLSDKNKNITAIAYNYLNLPQLVTIAGKGTIAFAYDAGGNKLQKTVTEGARITTTDYLSGFEYRNDSLQQLMHPEGRARYTKRYWQNGDSAYRYEWDYFYKDHLGNVRTTVTEQRDTANYWASFEIASRSRESQIFSRLTQTVATIGGIPGYPMDYTTNPNGYTSVVNGSSRVVGATTTLKVMAGDTLNIVTNAFVRKMVWDANNPPPMPLEDVAGALMSILPNRLAGLSSGKVSGSSLALYGSPLSAAITLFGNAGTANYTPTKTAAKLNWILLDEQLNYVPSGSNFIQAQNLNTLQVLTSGQLVAPKSGYLMVYVSNETPDVSAAFDNLRIHHRSGPLVQEDDYYAFGLGMAGISSKAAGSMTNKLKYNGKEEQRQEFGDGSGLEWMDYGARMYDNQIGRWGVVDPMAMAREWLSSFNYCQNNPINRVDPTGALDDDYLIRNNGDVIIKKTEDKFDRFYTQSSQKTEGNMTIRTYSLAEQLNKNAAGLVKFPDNGAGFTSYGAAETGGFSIGFKKGIAFRENVGSGDSYLKPQAAAALFGVIQKLRGKGITISLGDMSSSNGSDPANGGVGTFHHAGHGHMGKRSGLDVDFRYIGDDGNSFSGFMSDTKFNLTNNKAVYDAATRFGFDSKNTYQGTMGSVSGVKTMGGHNNHGHLGFKRTPSNFINYKPYKL